MTWNAVLPDTVKAVVRNGHVSLRGTVEWGYQQSEATRVVRHLAGVHGVTNLITIKPRLKPKAADIEHRVVEAIERMADLDARSIWVTTSNGTVHLHGHVHSLSEKRTAGHAAASGPGVTQVKNDIFVTP